jgi:DNA polymerase III subunit epsilon
MEPLPNPARTVVLDTETTGLSAAARIVEFAAVEVDPRSGAMGRRFHAIIDPEVPIPAVVTRIHGIRDCDVVGRPPFRALADEICAFIAGATVIAQNASFDKRMIEFELARAGRPTLATLGVSIIDTLAAARGLFPLLPRHSLDGICDHVGVDRAARQRHGALLDAELVARALPGMACAYDAWLAANDDDARVPAAVRSALRFLEAFGGDVRGAERTERAFVRTGIAARWAQRREAEFIERLACLVPLDGWCSRRYAAVWSASNSTAYKDAALALLASADLAHFRAESSAQYVIALPDATLGIADRLAALEPALDAVIATNDVAALTAGAIALRDAHRSLDAQRATLRETLLLHASEGYRPASARVDERQSLRTDYRAALKALAPDADLAPFRTSIDRLSLRTRDLTPCAALFRPPHGGGHTLRVA